MIIVPILTIFHNHIMTSMLTIIIITIIIILNADEGEPTVQTLSFLLELNFLSCSTVSGRWIL